jgi:gliding motility-associated-like protein
MNDSLFVFYRFIHISLLVSFPLLGVGQVNLVPNPSFEELDNCNVVEGNIDASIIDWYSVNGTCDLYNTCSTNPIFILPNSPSGFQVPKTGNGFVGMYLHNVNNVQNIPMEMLGVKLDQKLEAGKKYCIEFWVNPANESGYYTDCMEVLFTKQPLPSINDFDIINQVYIPQVSQIGKEIPIDTASWYRIQGEFVADGGEAYLTVGCFKRYENIDTLRGNTVPSVFINSAYYYVDDVKLHDCNQENLLFFVPNFFSPNGDDVNDVLGLIMNQDSSYSAIKLVIYNRWGSVVFSTNDAINNYWNGKNQWGILVSPGVYYYCAEQKNKTQKGIIHVNY